MHKKDRIVNYDKNPALTIPDSQGQAWKGYADIVKELQRKIKEVRKERVVLVLDYYHGTREQELLKHLVKPLACDCLIRCEDAKLPEELLRERLQNNITNDRVFGSMSTHMMSDFYDTQKVEELRQHAAAANGLVIVYGVGAGLVTHGDILVYGDLIRWEIQLRYRSKELDNWGAGNFDEDILRKYKRGYFVEWRVMDRHKKRILPAASYVLDTNRADDPSMVTKGIFESIMTHFTHQPFRMVPYFDEGIWGGHWMEKVCGLPHKENKYAWCFDGVPEENSIRAYVNDIMIELPAMNLVKERAVDLLGAKVFSRFGAEFPIRFDFLDTVGGGNLSLQVHPLTEYIHQNFNMPYTQDESYYILDADEDACVYLGVKDGVTAEQLIPALQKAEQGIELFEDEKYINCYPIKKHDHVLIPAGTIHCSGSGAMVLEISATPYIFTMKLWDWGRVGLDGKPRPINVDRGAESIQYDRTTDWCRENLINNTQLLQEDEHCRMERTGLHELEFIETRRYWFDEALTFSCDESVNMLNLIEGEEARILSTDHSFEPFTVHYAETFIIPECVKSYVIEPAGLSKGTRIAVMKASVRV